MRKYLCIAFQVSTLMAGLACAVFAAEDAARQPVFVYLQAEVTDHINIEITEDRLRHLLSMLEKMRKEHPDAHVSATVMFSGAVADALAQRNSQTHIVDVVKKYAEDGIIEVGYNGADEPTYATRPVLDFSNSKTVADRWHVRAAAAEQLLADGRDPVTGSPVPGKDGGLKRLQEVFGPVAYVTGLNPTVNMTPSPPSHAAGTTVMPKIPVPTVFPEMGADSEIVYEVHRYNDKAVMPGLPEDNPAMLPGFGRAEEEFLSLISPRADTSPEVYWQDNVLRLSEVSNTSEAAAEAEHDFKGLTSDEVKEDFGDLNRSRVQVVRVDLADERYYLRHDLTKDDEYPLKYAYAHPDNPALPADARIGSEAVDAAYAKEAAALEWISGQFFHVNAGSRFVSNAGLEQMTAPSTGFSVSLSGLRASMAELQDKWGINTNPPPFVEVDGRYLSLADTFQVLTDALAEFGRSGKLPDSIPVVAVWGPEHTPMSHGPNEGEVTVAAVAHAAASLAPRLHDTSDGDLPKNSIPIAVTVDGTPISSAQFLRLMVGALVAPSPDKKLRIRMTYMYPGQATLVPKTRVMTEMGASWTVKPGQLHLGDAPQSAQAQK